MSLQPVVGRRCGSTSLHVAGGSLLISPEDLYMRENLETISPFLPPFYPLSAFFPQFKWQLYYEDIVVLTELNVSSSNLALCSEVDSDKLALHDRDEK